LNEIISLWQNPMRCWISRAGHETSDRMIESALHSATIFGSAE